MKKMILSIIIIAMFSLFIVGCDNKNNGSTTTLPTAYVTTSSQASGPTTTTLPPVPLPEDIKALLAKANAVTSISFKETATKDFIFIKGTNAKRTLFQYRGVKDNERFDTIYLDLANKKAYAACTANDARCASVVRKKFWEVSYETFKPGATPVEFMKSVREASLNKKMTKILFDTTTVNMVFKDSSGNSGEMWVDTFYGVPYEVTIGGTTILYDKIVINSVKDSDVILPSDYVQI